MGLIKISGRRHTMQERNVIQRGHATNLTEALLVVAGGNTNNLVAFVKRVFSEVYYYTDGSLHMCNHPAIKDVLKNARDRAWEGRQHFSRNKNIIHEETRGMAAVLKLYKHYFEYAEHEEL